MRMRKKKHTPERIERCGDIFIKEPASFRGRWSELSGGKKICIEIGCGKGKFILEKAKREPDTFFVAMEKVPDVIVMAMEKVMLEGLSNVRFICADADGILDIFDKGEICDVYLNFSDPWPKKKQYKRRLTYREYLEKYKLITNDDGIIYFKTDNRPLFDFSLEEFAAAGLVLFDVTYDLHASKYAADNIMTEYEKNFSEKGFAINRLCAAKHLADKAEE